MALIHDIATWDYHMALQHATQRHHNNYYTHRDTEIFYSKPVDYFLFPRSWIAWNLNLDCTLHFSLIDLAPNGNPFGVKSINEKCKLQSKFGLH